MFNRDRHCLDKRNHSLAAKVLFNKILKSNFLEKMQLKGMKIIYYEKPKDINLNILKKLDFVNKKEKEEKSWSKL